MTKQNDRADVYQTVTDAIVAQIEQGLTEGKASMPWHRTGLTLPRNATTGKEYRGINILSLWVASQAMGFSSGYWGTYRQWASVGAQVRKGEKSSIVVFYKEFNREDQDEQGENGEEQQRRVMMARASHVFNSSQVDGWTPPDLPPALSEAERLHKADRFFEHIGATILYGGDQAYYRPSTDTIHMPDYSRFTDPLWFASVLGHEAAHWSGAKHRLNRDLSGRFKSESYAIEEAVAEISACFLMASLGLAAQPREDHAIYIMSWLKIFQADKRAIFTAASMASRVCDYLHALQPDAVEISGDDEAAA